jgi:hypothetical protein
MRVRSPKIAFSFTTSGTGPTRARRMVSASLGRRGVGDESAARHSSAVRAIDGIPIERIESGIDLLGDEHAILILVSIGGKITW